MPATSPSTAQSSVTKTQVRALRGLLESLEDLVADRARLAGQVKRQANSDNIKPRILREAAAVDKWVDVKPAMFEGTIEEELGKFDKYQEQLEHTRETQEDMLTKLKVSSLTAWSIQDLSSASRYEHNELFVKSRLEDAELQSREHILQSLDLAFHNYKEIATNLEQCLKVSGPTPRAVILG